MDLSDDATKTLQSILDSWLCGHGVSYDELFKDRKDLEEVYNSVNDKKPEPEPEEEKKGVVSEATPKSADERVMRSIRQTGRTRRTARHRERGRIDLPGRVTPKKTASSNDPSRGGNLIHNKDVTEDLKRSIGFVRENLSVSGKKLKYRIEEFFYRDTLRSLIEHMIATRLGGWHKEHDYFIKERGHRASSQYWNLNKDGKLMPIGIKKTSDYEIEWFLEAKLYCGKQEKSKKG